MNGDGLFIAQNVAAQLGATVIRNSWGGPEDPQATPTDIAQLEQYFIHPNIAIFAAAGDNGFNDMGAGPGYPATSANVVSVGVYGGPIFLFELTMGLWLVARGLREGSR